MPNDTTLKKFSLRQPLLLVIGAMAISYVSVVEDGTMPYRDIAAVKPISKMEVLKPIHKHELHKHMHKLRGPMTLQWNLIGEQPVNLGDTFELEVTFTTDEYIESVNAQLVIPPGVQLVQGPKNFEISQLATNAPQKMRFVFKQRSSRNEQIHLVATGAKGGLKFSDTIQFNTFLEHAIKKEKETLLKNSMQDDSTLNKVHF